MAEYIEREAAYALSKIICDAIRNREYHPATFGHLILDWIDDLPAADVAPVRHGRWIKADSNPRHGDFFCSDCQHGVDIGDGEETPIDRGFYYCFNCGCAMDGGET